MKVVRMEYPGKENVYLDGYLLDSGLKLGQDVKRPAVVICPGGGYVYLSPRESEPMALAYAAKGIHAFVLNYSVGWGIKGFAPFTELDWALGMIREHAEEWRIDEHKVLTCGFSAGGHLALAGGLLGNNKADGVILGYPAVNMDVEGGFMAQLLTGKEQPDEEEKKWLNLTKKVGKDAPPLFMFTTGEDALTRKMTLDLVMAYEENGLLCEYHLFQKGPHGYSLANEASADGSSQVINRHVAKWLDLSVEWIFAVFGELEFKDYSTSRIMDVIREMGIGTPNTYQNTDNIGNA